MKYSIEITKRFDRDLKKLKKKHYKLDSLFEVVEHLANYDREILLRKYKDHKLYGEWEGFRELHIQPDWLLI